MITFREFITKIYKYGHFVVYEPNRDCLVYESFFKYHSPYRLKKDKDGSYKWDFPKGETPYYVNNPWVEPFWHSEKDMDVETKEFIEKYGDYEVHSIEQGVMTKHSMKQDKHGDVKITWDDDTVVCCLGIFICVPDPERKYRDCNRCTYHKFIHVDESVSHKGYICEPDENCLECRNCWRYQHKDALETSEANSERVNSRIYELSRIAALKKYDAKLIHESKDLNEYNSKTAGDQLTEKDFKILKEEFQGWFH